MAEDLKAIQATLKALSGEILAGRWQQSSASWQGADVVIAEAPPSTPKDSFYPPPRVVVTPHFLELTWLFERLRDAFGGVLDGTSKVEFYGRLANAANRYLQKVASADQSIQDLLLAVTHEAHAIRGEMEDGEFRFLVVAPGNTIWDDLVERGEASGYLGPEATRRFFEDMEKKHRDA